MTRDDVEHWTREAGGFSATPEFLERFATLVAAAEREACARVCESIARDTYGMTNLREYGECAAAIRARS